MSVGLQISVSLYICIIKFEEVLQTIMKINKESKNHKLTKNVKK